MKQSPVRRARVATVATAAIAAGLLAPSAAHAALTTTSITSPAPESIFDSDTAFLSSITDDEMTVTGLAPGADGERVALVCTYTLNGVTLLVPLFPDEPVVVSDGAFSTTTARVPGLPCRLRAVPEDLTEDSELPESVDLSSYTGPRLITGGFSIHEDESPSSPSYGAQSYLSQRGQTKGLALTIGANAGFTGGGFSSGFAGGIYLTALLDDTYYRPLFGPSAFLTNFGFGFDPDEEVEFSDVGMIVDGRPAVPYAAVGAARSKVVSRTFDPVTADQTVVEEAPIALVVLDSEGEPEGIEPSGLKLRRTIKQDKEGRQIAVGDEFHSTDGAAHRIETRYLQSLYSSLFGGIAPGTIKEEASFRFPWVTGDAYVEPEAGDEYGPAPAGPTTIWVHGARQDFSEIVYTRGDRAAARADDGLVPRPEGALVFDSAPSNLKFLDTGIFVANFVRDVPAGGSAGVGQTFLQDLTSDGLKDLVEPPSAPPATPPAPPIVVDTPLPTKPPVLPSRPSPLNPTNPLPKLAKSTGRVLISKKQGARLRDRKPVTVTTKGMPAGRYGITIRRWVKNGRTIANGVKTIKKDGDLKVGLKLTKYGRWYLGLKKTRERKSVKVRVIVTWTPPGKGRLKQKTSYLTNFR